MRFVGFALGFTVGFYFFAFIYWIIKAAWYKKLKESVKDFFKNVFYRLTILPKLLWTSITGQQETTTDTATTDDQDISPTLLPFLQDDGKTPWYERVAKRLGTTVTPNTELRDTILMGLEQNKQKYGARYCPCIPPSSYAGSGSKKQSPTLACPCYKMRTNGICHCGLFVNLPVSEEKMYPDMAGETISALDSKTGEYIGKYVFDEKGKATLVPLDGSEGPPPPKKEPLPHQDLVDKANEKKVSITASSQPIPYVYSIRKEELQGT